MHQAEKFQFALSTVIFVQFLYLFVNLFVLHLGRSLLFSEHRKFFPFLVVNVIGSRELLLMGTTRQGA